MKDEERLLESLAMKAKRERYVQVRRKLQQHEAFCEAMAPPGR
jgi:hypothetical protein